MLGMMLTDLRLEAADVEQHQRKRPLAREETGAIQLLRRSKQSRAAGC